MNDVSGNSRNQPRVPAVGVAVGLFIPATLAGILLSGCLRASTDGEEEPAAQGQTVEPDAVSRHPIDPGRLERAPGEDTLHPQSGVRGAGVAPATVAEPVGEGRDTFESVIEGWEEPGADLDEIARQLAQRAPVRAGEGAARGSSGERRQTGRGLLGGDAPALPLVVTESLSAATWLVNRARLEDLVFQEASGYWANTYVPGDPAVRELQRRLMVNETIELDDEAMSGLAMATAATVNRQPFDPPAEAALAVYMHADRASVQTRSRVLLQVGLQGSVRQSGRRPPMNIGVVVDLSRALRDEDAASLRAMLETLAEASDIGDRFSLIVAGRAGGVVIPPGSFRYGPVSVALHQLLTEAPLSGVGQPDVTLTLMQALETASALVSGGSNVDSRLGTNLVLLVTSGDLDDDHGAVERWAHDNAVAGIPTSVVGIGEGVDIDQLDRVTLAGQGNRRLLSSPEEAMSLVTNELTASSRIVARAVRVRIRLAPGVELIDVLGSHRLGEGDAQRVRDAEQSIDQRLLREYGIETDRGEDEEGIQIIIPAFYAADAHVILLDVIVPGPGPVADVTVRYKDLVHLGNGIARDNLWLRRDIALPTPLERNVLKNQLAYEFSLTLRMAGELVDRGRAGEALALIGRFVDLLRELQRELPDLERDPEVENDIAIAVRYLDVINTTAIAAARPSPGDMERQRDVADSLRYGGYRRNMAETQLELE